jgi:hypothetical protein
VISHLFSDLQFAETNKNKKMRGNRMEEEAEFNGVIIELLRRKLEERHEMELSDFNEQQIVELWTNKYGH